jgi:uncharacterized protein (TIGR03437 family)
MTLSVRWAVGFLLGWAALHPAMLRAQGPAGPVRITWVGQACFMIQEVGSDFIGPIVITDPPGVAQGYELPTVPADAVTVTHNHGDHNNVAGIRGAFTLVDGRSITSRTEVAAAQTTFVMVPGFHDNTNGSQRGQNSIIRWTQAGIRFAHFGDYGQDRLSDQQMADLGTVDIAFIPAGGVQTIDIAGVDALVSQLRPKVAILMHYRTGLGGAAAQSSIDGFGAAGASPRPVRFRPGRVSVTPATLPATTEYWVMEVDAPMAAVNAATFSAGQPVAPGSLVSLFGSFPGSATAGATSLPLPRQLGTTDVLINGQAVPLLYASPQQVNVQLPAGTNAGQYAVEVRVGGQRAARGPVSVLPSAPGLFTALNQDGRLNSAANPARRGEVIQIYATGQGAVTPAVIDGAAAPAPPATSAITPSVAIAGRLAPVQFSGLAPNLVGVWQINVVVPAETPVGDSIPVVAAAGLVSNALTIAVR